MRSNWGDINEAQAQTLKDYFAKTPASEYEMDPISKEGPIHQIELDLDALVVELCRKGAPTKHRQDTFSKIEAKYRELNRLLTPPAPAPTGPDLEP